MKKYLKFMLIVILLFTLCIFVVPNSLSKYKSTIKNSINITIKRPEYTVKFNANGGTGSMSDISVKRDVSQALPSNTFTRSGYDFIGWNTNADGSGVSYSNGQEIAYASISDGEIITLYAQWLQLHEPGVYESSEGYNKSLKTYSGRKYEIYRYAETSSVISIFAGETSTTTKGDKHCVAQFAKDASSNAKFVCIRL